ncbi:NmrA-like family protein [Trametes coccinea BRFM310]|uniref:NmrA-like family protein n=1 Tax=Trametes coccinea (strain BRFM310) TaxID=1353009 RepID=A0A1Y2I8U1_TRAC3|nr:NmrA-like family protein [Trametes coccinea BRFM310]
MTKYVITGATGGLGSQVFKYLLKLVPASDVVVSLYNPAGATQAIKESGVEIRRGDYGDPASLDAAFAGADKLLIVSYPSIAHELRVKHHRNAIDAAKRAGVKHVYYTSLAFAGDSVAAVMQAHIDTERYLKESGLTYTIVREGIYSESYPLYFGFFNPAEGKDEVVIPHSDGGIAWVSREDLGEGTAKLIVEGGYENQTLLFSGSRAITLKEIAEKISGLLGRNIQLVVSTEDEYVRANVGKNGPRGEEEFLRKWATTYKALKRGELDVVDPLLQKIVGRELKPFEATLKEMLGLAGSVMEQYAK